MSSFWQLKPYKYLGLLKKAPTIDPPYERLITNDPLAKEMERKRHRKGLNGFFLIAVYATAMIVAALFVIGCFIYDSMVALDPYTVGWFPRSGAVLVLSAVVFEWQIDHRMKYYNEAQIGNFYRYTDRFLRWEYAWKCFALSALAVGTIIWAYGDLWTFKSATKYGEQDLPIRSNEPPLQSHPTFYKIAP